MAGSTPEHTQPSESEIGGILEASTSGPIKLGVITDQTGPLSFMGIANANVARQHHVRMNMYIAQARGGRFEVVESLGVIDPKEALVSIG